MLCFNILISLNHFFVTLRINSVILNYEHMRIVSLFICILLITGCKKEERSVDNLIKVDVLETSYPEKELFLQDFMEVEYIPLETNDTFLTHGFVQDVGEKYIIVKNRKNDGDIFIYDRSGKALRKFNRKGQGGEEYINILGIALDESHEEIFVNSHHSQRILVYDLFGNYKRTLKYKATKGSLASDPLKAEISSFYSDIFNYDKDHLICYDILNSRYPFVLMSKNDGSITKYINIPFDEKRMAIAMRKDENSGLVESVSSGYYRTILSFRKEWFLLEFSSDTIYQLQPNYCLSPVFVRTPPVDSMSPEIFLMIRLLSDRYIFMETVKNEYDFEKNKGFSRKFFLYDKEQDEFFNYRVYNSDYSSKKEIYMNVLRPIGGEIGAWQEIDASSLLESLEKGELKGKLENIARTLDEDSNPVIMLTKNK